MASKICRPCYLPNTINTTALWYLRKILINKGVKLQSDTLVTAVDFEQQGDKKSLKGWQPSNKVNKSISLYGTMILWLLPQGQWRKIRAMAPVTLRLISVSLMIQWEKRKAGYYGMTLPNNRLCLVVQKKFNRHAPKSAWMSATLTCKDLALLRKISENTVSIRHYQAKQSQAVLLPSPIPTGLWVFTINRQPQFLDQP